MKRASSGHARGGAFRLASRRLRELFGQQAAELWFADDAFTDEFGRVAACPGRLTGARLGGVVPAKSPEVTRNDHQFGAFDSFQCTADFSRCLVAELPENEMFRPDGFWVVARRSGSPMDGVNAAISGDGWELELREERNGNVYARRHSDGVSRFAYMDAASVDRAPNVSCVWVGPNGLGVSFGRRRLEAEPIAGRLFPSRALRFSVGGDTSSLDTTNLSVAACGVFVGELTQDRLNALCAWAGEHFRF